MTQINTKYTDKTAIWAEHPFQLYSVVEFLRLNPEKDVSTDSTTLVTKRSNIDIIRDHPVLSKFKLLIIEDYHKHWYGYIRLLLETLLVPKDFSSVYQFNNQLEDHFKTLSIFQKISPFHKKRENINKASSSFIKSLAPFYSSTNIKFDRIYCFTKVINPVLLHLFSKERITVMESWDHPMKFPYLFDSKFSFTWNKSLKSDSYKFQGAKEIKQIKPLKFLYIERFSQLSIEEIENKLSNSIYKDEIQLLKDKKIVLYPTTSSSKGKEHAGEIKLLEALCAIPENEDYFLYIKPKPNGPVGDYDMFKKMPNVIVGKYSQSFDSRDMLDENYHLFRYYLIQKSVISINAGTTFGLEIAYAGKPLIQLNVNKEFHAGFSKFVNTYHLSNYVLSIPGTVQFNGDISEIKEKIRVRDMNFSQNLYKWIIEW